jgi:hypothetical protein
MSIRSRGLFHTRMSALINIGRLLPRQVVSDVLDTDLPFSSKEGFVRQVLGWREFVRHVHRVTDGFRDFPTRRPSIAKTPGNGGYGRWKGRPWAEQQRDEKMFSTAKHALLAGDRLTSENLPDLYG